MTTHASSSSTSTSTSTNACPWGNPAGSGSASGSKSPKMQEILDEELAKSLMEADLKALANESLASEQSQLDEQFAAVLAEEEKEEKEDATTTSTTDRPDAFDDGDDYNDEDDDDDGLGEHEDDLDEYFRAKGGRRKGNNNSPLGVGSGKHRLDASLKLTLGSDFDKRTLMVFTRLMRRHHLHGVDKRLHSSTLSAIHHAVGPVVSADAETDVDVDSSAHYVVKIMKAPRLDYDARMTSEALLRSQRPMHAEMAEKSVRRHLKTMVDHESSAMTRARRAGVNVPRAICSLEHVLVMDFVGDEESSCAAPALRDVALTEGQVAQVYLDLLGAMRKLYHDAKLVHGGLNEYSVLFHHDACWLVDFAHASNVNHADHEAALEADVRALHGFFTRQGLAPAAKHRIGLLDEQVMKELVMTATPARVLNAYPCLKPYFYHKKATSPSGDVETQGSKK